MEDPNLPTRQTVKHKSELDRIFEEQCLFVSPLYAVAEGSEARDGGNTDNLPRRGGRGQVTNRGGDEAGAGFYEVLPDNSVIIHTTEHVDAVLEELSPSFVVVVSPDLAVTRHLEVYKAQHPKTTLRVYYLTYSQSVEEQRYMSEVRRETEAFKTLIENKATMVVPDDQDGKSTDVVTIAPDAPRPTSTRKGGTAPARRTKVIVDVREFRSALPSLLHSKGMNLEPLTLEVGDYILSPDICVERKSVPDLVGSFASGRLFQQAEKMTRFYKLAILLIEFDEHRPFGLQSVSSIGQDIVAGSITSKLVLLTLHFPTLRVLWMRSPHVTAQMFDELKQNQLEPDGAEAEKVGLEAEDARGQYAIVPQDILRKLPGINPNNVTYVMNHVESLHQLSTLSLDKLTALIGAVNAKQLHEFLHARGPTSLAAFQDAVLENTEETECP
jgi:DNA excision repair protein ERCC-4